jgi:hypothetical protein
MSAPNPRLDVAVGTRLTNQHTGPLLTSLLSISIVSIVASVAAAFFNPAAFAYAWLWAFFCYFPLLLGGLYWILLHYVCDSRWSVIPKRIWENATSLFWVALLLFAIGFLIPPNKNPNTNYSLAPYVFKWLSPVGQATLADSRTESQLNRDSFWDKSVYLNYPMYLVRAIIYSALLIGISYYYRSSSVAQDASGHPMFTVLMRRYACPLMVVWALVESYSGFDWLMAVDWKWNSSLFGVYTYAIAAQSSLAATIVLIYLFKLKGYFEVLNQEHFHLMGKLLFGFTIFWGYITFGQFLLDWYANIPEETIFYNDHNRGGWVYVTWLVIVGKFVLPVLLLIPQETKRQLPILAGISALILGMHFIEMFWLIMPYSHSHAYWISAVTFATFTSLLGYFFVRNSNAVALYPIKDPRLNECLTIKS